METILCPSRVVGDTVRPLPVGLLTVGDRPDDDATPDTAEPIRWWLEM